jgi:hypothetical protein
MKTCRIVLAVLFLFISLTGFNQTIRRVDGNPANGAPYTTIAAAVAAASAGDTIHIVGAATAYAGATITKKLVIIGPGYFLGENSQTQVNKSAARLSSALRFSAGSDTSFVMGLHFDFTGGNVLLDGAINNIIIKRNLMDGYVNFNNTNSGSNNNITIQQNYFSGSNPLSYSYTSTNNNIFLLNNYIEGTIHGLNSSTLQIKNNIIETGGNEAFSSSYPVSNSLIQNNIIRIAGASPSANLNGTNSFTNNICNVAVFGTANSNQASVDLSTVFEVDPAVVSSAPFTSDSRWALKAGSPAIGAGASGEDCGMFGGSDPYVLSGLPPVPAIYELTVPSTATQSGGLNVTIKAKSHQ